MKDFLFSNVQSFRFERKFYVEDTKRQDIETLLKLHPAMFQEIYQERKVNNIYFDSPALEHYYENVDGIARRLKVRIRWYGSTFRLVNEPVLELKLKHNLHIAKLHYPLKSFLLDRQFSLKQIKKLFNETAMPFALKEYLMGLHFSLLNNYKRKYYLSADRKYRITVDSDIEAYKISPFDNSFVDKHANYRDIIIELKYNKVNDDFVDSITNYLPFRLTRSSKYLIGIRRIFS